MNPCSCGNPVDDGAVLCQRCAALRILELNTGATEKEIKDAYLILVKVWHPDRFQADNALKKAAEAKLKEINSAYSLLTSKSSQAAGRRRTGTGSRHAAQHEPARKTESATYRAATGKTAPAVSPIRLSSAWILPTLNILFKFVLAAIAILLCRYLWIAFDIQGPTSEAAAKVYGYGKDSLLSGLEAPKRRFQEAVEQDLQRLGFRQSAPAPEVLPQPQQDAPAANPQPGLSAPADRRQATTIKSAPKARKVYSYITVGSTRNEVLDQLGTPTASTDNKLVYGRSELYFKDDSVIGWRIDRASSPIRVKLWPESSVDPSLDSFTVGSSMDDVLVVQGTPTAFSEDKFEYGGSEVYFQNRRVVRWKSDPASIPLRAKLP
jgi:DnaJ domain